MAKVGNKTHDLKQAHHEIYLNDDERIVGYEATTTILSSPSSGLFAPSNYTIWDLIDFVFIIASKKTA